LISDMGPLLPPLLLLKAIARYLMLRAGCAARACGTDSVFAGGDKADLDDA
jgi:hypothetical protein